MSCDWPVDRTCLADLPAEGDDGYDAALAKRSRAEDTATLVLWALTGRRFGICDYTVRPCPTFNPVNRYGPSWSTRLLWWDGGNWNTTSCGCTASCVANGPGMVHLPGPVVSVSKVQVGVMVLGTDEYTVEGNVLYRTNGLPWPSQNLGHPLGAFDTWSVDYQRGEPVPAGGDMMAGALAKEFMAACDGGTCRLPKTVVSLTRQGVTHQFDPTKIIAAGFTGLPEVDQWVQAVNPHRLMQAPVVL